MRLAFFGDVIGKSGRDGLTDHLPGLKRDLKLDFVVVNAENAAGGFGITEHTAKELFMAGADWRPRAGASILRLERWARYEGAVLGLALIVIGLLIVTHQH